MNNNVAKKGVVVFLITWITCLCACNPTPYGGKHMDLYTAAAFSIVGAEDTKELAVIDRDDYGRRLVYLEIGNPVFYTYYSNRTKETMNAHVFLIVQRTMEKKVYYYEDVCFRVYEKTSDFTDLEKKELENRNDWDMPLNEERMTCRNVIERKKAKLSATEVDLFDGNNCNDPWRAFYLAYYNREISKPQDEAHLFSELLDVDKGGNLLWVIHRYDNTGDGSVSIQGYFLLAGPDWVHTKNAVVKEIENIDAYWEEMPAFKRANGWLSL